MNTPGSHSAAGFTLIEVLIGVALLALLFITVAVLITRSTQLGRASALDANASGSLTRLAEQVGQDIGSGQSILKRAGTRRIELYKLGEKIALDPAPGESRYGKSTVRLRGNPLRHLVGQNVVLVGSQGQYLVTRVASAVASGAHSQVTFSCLLSLPGTLSAYPYRELVLEEAGGLRRSENGAAQVVGTDVQTVVFEPVYGAAVGAFTPTPQPPSGHQGGELLSALNFALTNRATPPMTASGRSRLNIIANQPWECAANPAAPANNLGKLQINVLYAGTTTGPSGVTPNVGVSGPGVNQSVTTFTKKLYEAVQAGAYSVVAPSITRGSLIYDATVRGNPASVGDGRQGTVDVNYLVRKGRVVFNVTGLPTPPPAAGIVRLSGPEPLDFPARNGSADLRLTPGSYTFSADTIGVYEPTITPSTLNVTSLTNTTVNVAYSIPRGTVELRVTGLPSPPPTTGYVRVTGPEAQSVQARNGTTTLSLRTGTYAVMADQIAGYRPTLSSSAVTVGKNTSTTVNVAYSAPLGTLQLRVEGLPAGRQAPLTVSGPSIQTLNVTTGTTQSLSLTPGRYPVTAPPLTFDAVAYTPNPASTTVDLTESGATHVVTYSAAPGGGGSPTPGGGGSPTPTPTPGGGGSPTSGTARVTRLNSGTASAAFRYQPFRIVGGRLVPVSGPIDVAPGTSHQIEVNPSLFYKFTVSVEELAGACSYPLGADGPEICVEPRITETADGVIDAAEVVGSDGALPVYRLNVNGHSYVSFRPSGNRPVCYDKNLIPIECPREGL